uniref:Uncharacterized protein n=1 Tax=Cacopsylla melanoneura TaxID=428564 RepID=A0A8D9BSB4_9HEMI
MYLSTQISLVSSFDMYIISVVSLARISSKPVCKSTSRHCAKSSCPLEFCNDLIWYQLGLFGTYTSGIPAHLGILMATWVLPYYYLWNQEKNTQIKVLTNMKCQYFGIFERTSMTRRN